MLEKITEGGIIFLIVNVVSAVLAVIVSPAYYIPIAIGVIAAIFISQTELSRCAMFLRASIIQIISIAWCAIATTIYPSLLIIGTSISALTTAVSIYAGIVSGRSIASIKALSTEAIKATINSIIAIVLFAVAHALIASSVGLDFELSLITLTLWSLLVFFLVYFIIAMIYPRKYELIE